MLKPRGPRENTACACGLEYAQRRGDAGGVADLDEQGAPALLDQLGAGPAGA